MWKVDGKDVNLPVSSVKKNAIDFEIQMNQQIILNKNEIGKEIVNDLIKAAINVSHKMKCEYCNSKFANLDSLKRHMRKFHKPMIKEEKLYTCDICHKTFPHPSKLKRHTSTHIAQPKTNLILNLLLCMPTLYNVCAC